MREIKFRAWDKEKKKMIYGIENFDLYAPLEYEDLSFSDFLNDENFEVEQYTGLKDSTGKEIYEGDTVKRNSKVEHTNLEIKFLDGSFCVGKNGISPCEFNYWSTIRDVMSSGWKQSTELELEVIGNIHE